MEEGEEMRSIFWEDILGAVSMSVWKLEVVYLRYEGGRPKLIQSVLGSTGGFGRIAVLC